MVISPSIVKQLGSNFGSRILCIQERDVPNFRGIKQEISAKIDKTRAVVTGMES